MARPTNAELAARRLAAESAGTVQVDAPVVDAPVVEAPVAAVAPVASDAIDLPAIAASISATFTPHEHGGVFTKGTRKLSLNLENYKSERQVRKVLAANGF